MILLLQPDHRETSSFWVHTDVARSYLYSQTKRRVYFWMQEVDLHQIIL